MLRILIFIIILPLSGCFGYLYRTGWGIEGESFSEAQTYYGRPADKIEQLANGHALYTYRQKQIGPDCVNTFEVNSRGIVVNHEFTAFACGP